MAPELIPAVVAPLLLGAADYEVMDRVVGNLAPVER
jgi:hypothetical protein